MKKLACVNGKIVPLDKAVVSVLDYGLLYGFGVFETMRAYNNRVFKMEEHLGRLEKSCKKVGIKVNLNAVGNSVKKLLIANRLKNAYIRVTLTYGVGKPRLAFGRQKTTFIVIADSLPENLSVKQKRGVRAGFSRVRHYSGLLLNQIKSTNYLQTALRKKEARERRLDDVIILNEKNNVVEASTSNIFIVDKKDRLITPRLQDGCLPGITKKTVLQIARRLKIKTIEKTIKPKELLNAKEIFITNSIMEIIPVRQAEKKEFKKRAITRRLQAEYKRQTKQP